MLGCHMQRKLHLVVLLGQLNSSNIQSSTLQRLKKQMKRLKHQQSCLWRVLAPACHGGTPHTLRRSAA